MMEHRRETPVLPFSIIVSCLVAAMTVTEVIAPQMVIEKDQWSRAKMQYDAEISNIFQKTPSSENSEIQTDNADLPISSQELNSLKMNSSLTNEEEIEPMILDKRAARVCLQGLVVSTLGVDKWPAGNPEVLDLGDMFLHVASAWAVARFHDVRAAVPKRIIDRLNIFFIGIKRLVQPLDQVIESRRRSGQFPCHQDMNENVVRWAVRPRDDWEDHVFGILSRGPLLLKSGDVYPAYIAPLIPELHKTLRIRSRFVKWADNKLHLIRNSFTRFSIDEEQWSFVAVHGLRGSADGIDDEEGDVSTSFYARAVAWLRGHLDKELRGRRVLLAVTSHNREWATRRLVPALKSGVRPEKAFSVAWAGADPETDANEAEMLELAVLLTCNHSVASHGSLPVTAALLNDGQYAFWALGPSNLTTAFSWLLPQWKMLY